MSDRIKKIKIKQSDGTFSDYIPIGADAKNIDTTRGESVQSVIDKTARYYNSIAEMKLDDNIQVGDTCVTLGYYEVNDGGSGTYKIADDSSLEDDGGSVHELNNGLKAQLVIEKDIINFDSLGGKAVSEQELFDNSNILDKAIKICQNNNITKIHFNDKKYYFASQIIINDEDLSIELLGNNKTLFLLANDIDFAILFIKSINTFIMDSITVEIYKYETLTWDKRKSYFFEKQSDGNSNKIIIQNCSFRYVRIGIKINQKYITNHTFEEQNLNKYLLIQNCIFEKVRNCIHLANIDKAIISNCICSGLNEDEYVEAGGTRKSVIFYIRPNIDTLILNDLTISECTGDVLHFNQFDYGTDEPYPEDYPEYFVKNVLINNIRMNNIGIFIGLNSYTKTINASNIIINNTIGGSTNAVIQSFEGKFEDIKINNFYFKDIHNLLFLQENSRGGNSIIFSNGTIEHGTKYFYSSLSKCNYVNIENVSFKRINTIDTNSASLLFALDGKYDSVKIKNIFIDIDYKNIGRSCELIRFGPNFAGNILMDGITVLDTENSTKTYGVNVFYALKHNEDNNNIFAILNNINVTNTNIVYTIDESIRNNFHFLNCFKDKELYTYE